MDGGSPATGTVVIPAFNCAATLLPALESVEAAIAHFQNRRGQGLFEIIVVDDGSTDATAALAKDFAASRPHVRYVAQPRNLGPGAARNRGAAEGTGAILFFLDGDDMFLPEHLDVAVSLLDMCPEAGFAKTGVALDEAIHPAWKESIENSVVINTAVRRVCHDFIEGFFEEAPFQTLHAEDALYSGLLLAFFAQVRTGIETVRHLVYPGNAFDRQREKFSRPPADSPDAMTQAERAVYPAVTAIYEARRQKLAAKAAAGWSGPPVNHQGPKTFKVVIPAR
jgi:glycosyltransferase involved in cell wall biosynthesis